jgi:hypothetical protein
MSNPFGDNIFLLNPDQKLVNNVFYVDITFEKSISSSVDIKTHRINTVL